MKKGLAKGFSFVLLLFVLFFSYSFSVFAAIPSTLTPYHYIFFMASSACGFSSDSSYILCLESAFEGYLESVNNISMLEQIAEYKKLSWGDTANNLGAFISTFRDWLSLADIDSNMLNLPTFSSPTLNFREIGFQSTPFNDSSLSSANAEKYKYLFSQGCIDNNCYAHSNLYAPVETGEVIFVFDLVTTKGNFWFSLYSLDSSEPSGLAKVYARATSCSYNSDGSIASVTDGGFCYTVYSYTMTILDLLRCPYKIFPDLASASEYAKTGNYTNLIKENTCSLPMADLLDSSVGDRLLSVESLVLPSSVGEARIKYENVSSSQNLDERSERLKEAGLDVSYSASYTVEHYKQNTDGKTFSKEETENFTSTVGAMVNFDVKTYPGFTFAEGLTEPDNRIISADNELTIKLYYLRDLISYIVEHYQQDIADESGKQGWTLVDQDLLSGLFETEAAFVPKNYSGFTYDESLTNANRIIPADDRTLTIKLYYTRNPVQYIVEHYIQDLIKQSESSGWTLADREVLSGIAGMQADCPKKSYAGLMYNSSLTEPADRRIRSDGSLVIRMYYVQNLFGDFKEPLETVTKKMIVLSAAVLPFTFIVLFLIRLFKQILSKA